MRCLPSAPGPKTQVLLTAVLYPSSSHGVELIERRERFLALFHRFQERQPLVRQPLELRFVVVNSVLCVQLPLNAGFVLRGPRLAQPDQFADLLTQRTELFTERGKGRRLG